MANTTSVMHLRGSNQEITPPWNKAFQAKHWSLEDELLPAKSYVEKLLDKVEKDDLKAELLSEVLCVRDDADEIMQPVWGKDGTLRAMKVTANIELPTNPEQLRWRLAILGTAWAFVASTHAQRPKLRILFTEFA